MSLCKRVVKNTLNGVTFSHVTWPRIGIKSDFLKNLESIVVPTPLRKENIGISFEMKVLYSDTQCH